MTPTFASPQLPRVLLSASSGAGHVRTAQALEKALQNRGDCHVQPRAMAHPAAARTIVEDALGLLH